MTQHLSPGAQAVAWAYDNTPERPTGNHRYHWLGYALRAAADQAAPEKQLEDIAYIHESYVDGMRDALACIEIIADELQTHPIN